ncbi:MAG: VOC family protein [Bryobacter sp.]
MQIKLTSLLVDDQAKAIKFYTEVFGFRVKHNIPMGSVSWITVVSADGPDDRELTLEPNRHPAAKAYQEALFRDKIPLTAFEVSNLDAEFERLSALGVVFQAPPQNMGPVRVAVCADTCGNWIQLYQPVL